jgi:gamma-glutamylputrescine oxidase
MNQQPDDAEIGPLRIQWGTAPWRRRHIATKPFAPAEINATYELAIIGGGLTGCSAAFHLARRGRSVVLLEARRIGDGASGRTGGLVLEGTARGVMEGASTCLAELQSLVRDEQIDCNLSLPGCWEIAHRPPARPALELPWRDNEAPVSIVRLVPGGVVDPMALLTGLANLAARSGAVIHENLPVGKIDAGPPAKLETPAGSIRANHVIVAVNAWTSMLVAEMGEMGSSLTLACATPPLSQNLIGELGLSAGIPFYTIDQPYLWGRLSGDGRVIFGAGLAWAEPDRLEEIGLGNAVVEECFTRLERRIRGLHPHLQGIGALTRWGGPIAIPDTMTPIIGRLPSTPYIFVAGGYSGHGVALSVHAGKLIADAITEGAALPKWGMPVSQ